MTHSGHRPGVLARKLGMTRIFDDHGVHVPVTVLALEGCHVIGWRSDEDRSAKTAKGGSVPRNDGYRAVIMGIGDKKPARTTKAGRAQFAAAGVAPRAKLVEFRLDADASFPDVGAEVQADHFVAGQRVDIAGTTIGKGFAGAMKRWNFGGMRASHGVSVSHRAHGSTGQCQDPGRVFKGKKMAGHYGACRVTVQNLQVVRIDLERNLVLVKGAVPGHRGAFVEIRDAVKKPLHADAPPHGSFRVVPPVAADKGDESGKIPSSEAGGA